MKLFYTTEEVCGHLNIPKTTLEYYILEFKLNIKKAGKSRKFVHRDLERLERIVDLTQQQGFTIEGTKEQLRLKQIKKQENEEVINKLQDIKKSLVFLRNGIE